MKVGVWFPGQGVGAAGIARICNHDDIIARLGLTGSEAEHAREMLQILSSATDVSRDTRVMQPAIYLLSFYLYVRCAELLIPHDRLYAGHSLGQYTASVAAGWCSPVEGYSLVRQRGEHMHTAVSGTARGGMIALIGEMTGDIQTYIADHPELFPANTNSSHELVVAGTHNALGELGAVVARKLRAIPLAVAGPFHSPLLSTAAQAYDTVLSHAASAGTFFDPAFPVIANSSGAPLTDRHALLTEMRNHMVSPVEWAGSMEQFRECDLIVQVGPGDVLAKLARRSLPEVTVYTYNGEEHEYAALAQALSGVV